MAPLLLLRVLAVLGLMPR